MSARSLDDPIEDDEEEQKENMQHMIDRVKKEVIGMNQYVAVKTAHRNVLLCGRTRSGKTTATRVLRDPCYQPDRDTIFSETVHPKFTSFTLRHQQLAPPSSPAFLSSSPSSPVPSSPVPSSPSTSSSSCSSTSPSALSEEGEKYTINVVDTPGLFEVRAASDDQKARSNQQIQSVISRCLEHEITGVHAVILFASFETGINPEDIAALRTFAEMFGGSGVKMALCITRADRHNAKWRQERKREIMEHAELKDLIAQEQMEVLFLGCVEATGGAVQLTEEQMWNAYKTVYQMRKQMLEFIFAAKQRVSLTAIGVAKAKIARLSQKAEQCIQAIETLLATSDHTTQAAQEVLMSLEEVGQEIRESRAYMTITEMTAFTARLDALMRQVRDASALSVVIANRMLSSLGFPPRASVVMG